MNANCVLSIDITVLIANGVSDYPTLLYFAKLCFRINDFLFCFSDVCILLTRYFYYCIYCCESIILIICSLTLKGVLVFFFAIYASFLLLKSFACEIRSLTILPKIVKGEHDGKRFTMYFFGD